MAKLKGRRIMPGQIFEGPWGKVCVLRKEGHYAICLTAVGKLVNIFMNRGGIDEGLNDHSFVKEALKASDLFT